MFGNSLHSPMPFNIIIYTGITATLGDDRKACDGDYIIHAFNMEKVCYVAIRAHAWIGKISSGTE